MATTGKRNRKTESPGDAAEANGPAEKKAPVARFKSPVPGGTLEVAVWRNTVETERGLMVTHNCTVSRSYKKDDQWQSTSVVRGADLAALSLLAQRAFYWVLDNRPVADWALDHRPVPDSRPSPDSEEPTPY